MGKKSGKKRGKIHISYKYITYKSLVTVKKKEKKRRRKKLLPGQASISTSRERRRSRPTRIVRSVMPVRAAATRCNDQTTPKLGGGDGDESTYPLLCMRPMMQSLSSPSLTTQNVATAAPVRKGRFHQRSGEGCRQPRQGPIRLLRLVRP